MIDNWHFRVIGILGAAALSAEIAVAQQPFAISDAKACACVTRFQQTVFEATLLDTCRRVNGPNCLGFELRITKPWTLDPSGAECRGGYEYWQHHADPKPKWSIVGRYPDMTVDLSTARERCKTIGMAGAFDLLAETETSWRASPTLDDLLSMPLGKTGIVLAREADGRLTLVMPDGRREALQPTGRTDQRYALLADDDFLTAALNALLIASSEHSSIKGTINGGGDFVRLWTQDALKWRSLVAFRPEGVVFQVPGGSILLASSEFSSIRGTINGGGDFIYNIEYLIRLAHDPMFRFQEEIANPGLVVTQIGTRYALDMGLNGVVAVAVVEGRVRAKDKASGRTVDVGPGQGALFVPGRGLSPAIVLSAERRAAIEKALAAPVSVTPVATSGAAGLSMAAMAETEPNDDETAPMAVRAGSTIAARFSFEHRPVDRDRFRTEASQPGRYTVTVQPERNECSYSFQMPFASAQYRKGDFSVVIERGAVGPEGTRFVVIERAPGQTERRIETTRRDAPPYFDLVLENTVFNERRSASGHEVQCAKEAPYSTALPYRLTTRFEPR